MKTISMTKVLIDELDVPNKNGRTYSRAVVEQAIYEFEKIGKPLPMISYMPMTPHPTFELDRVVGHMDTLYISDNSLLGEAKYFKPGFDNFDVRITSTGKLNEDVVVECKFDYCVLTMDPA